jgi:hypothetical protein
MTIFMDSFQYATAQVPRKWNVTSSSPAAPDVITSGGPYNNRYIRTQNNGGPTVSGNGKIQKTIGQSQEFSICFGFRRDTSIVGTDDATTTFCSLLDGATAQLRLALGNGERVGIYRGTTLLAEIDFSIARQNWYHVRWKVVISDSAPANSNQVQLVGPGIDATATVATGAATRVTSNNYASDVLFDTQIIVAGANVNRQHLVSDVYISNEEAVLLPNLRVHPLRPTGNGTTMQWTPNTGTAWEALDDATPDDDTTKISTSTDAHIALFEHAGLPTPAESVKAVQMAAWSKKDDAFDVALEPVYRISGTNYFVDESPVGNAYAAIHAATDEDPAATAPWTESVVNAMEIGVRVKHG